MNRRDTLRLLLAIGAGGLPLGVRSQARPYRIATPHRLTPEGRVRLAAAFAAHGWREERDYVVIGGELNYGDEIEESVRRMLQKQPHLALVTSTAYAVAAHRQTKTTPIVMFSSGYPVEAGLAATLSRPGKNVTGNTLYAGVGIWGKLIELLRQADPAVRRVGVLWTYVPPLFPAEEIVSLGPELADASRKLGTTFHRVDVDREEQMDAALAEMSAQGVDALLLTFGPAFWPRRQDVLAYAAARRWPTIIDFAYPPQDPGRRPLITYAPSWDDLRTRSVDYIVRILRDGAKPGELPIQRPAKFEMVLNLAAARELGLTMPQSLVLRADRVLE